MRARTSPLVSTGHSSCSRRHCVSSSSRMLPRLLRRVLQAHHPLLRASESIGGLVTWLKFCRKKCDAGRDTGRRARRAACRRPSSRRLPCRPPPSGGGSARGLPCVKPAATWRRRSSSRLEARAARPRPSSTRSSRSMMLLDPSPYGCCAGERVHDLAVVGRSGLRRDRPRSSGRGRRGPSRRCSPRRAGTMPVSEPTTSRPSSVSV